MAYAGSHPEGGPAGAGLPIPPGVAAESAAEDQAKAQQAALDAFAAQCVAANCALGPDPKGAVDALLSAARAGKGPGGASVAALATAITTALGYPNGDRVASTVRLANTLAAARGGDVNQLNNLINASEALRETDGQFVNRCGDALSRPTRTGFANSSSPGASNTRSSAPSRR